MSDVVFDVCVGAHLAVEFSRVTFEVGVVAPEPVLQVGQEALLGAGVQRLAAHDQPGSFGPGRQVDQLGEIGDHGDRLAIGVQVRLAVGAKRRDPSVDVLVCRGDGRRDGVLATGHDLKADVALPAAIHEPSRAARRVRPGQHRRACGVGVVAASVTGGDLFEQLVDRRVQHGHQIRCIIRGCIT